MAVKPTGFGRRLEVVELLIVAPRKKEFASAGDVAGAAALERIVTRGAEFGFVHPHLGGGGRVPFGGWARRFVLKPVRRRGGSR